MLTTLPAASQPTPAQLQGVLWEEFQVERTSEGKARDWDRESRAAPSELREMTRVRQVVDGLR